MQFSEIITHLFFELKFQNQHLRQNLLYSTDGLGTTKFSASFDSDGNKISQRSNTPSYHQHHNQPHEESTDAIGGE